MEKIKVRLVGKFKSNPTPTAGLLFRLRTELDEYNTLRGVVSEACQQISDLSQDEPDPVQRKVFEDFARDQPDYAQSSYAELLEKYENSTANPEYSQNLKVHSNR